MITDKRGDATHHRSRIVLFACIALASMAAYLGGARLAGSPSVVEGLPQDASEPAVRGASSARAVRDPAPPNMQLGAAGSGAEEAAAEEDDELTGPGIKPAPTYLPRDPEEWQGMLVDVGFEPDCEQSTSCGWARACVDGRCTACRGDNDCSEGEVCVLDHCLLEANTDCRSRVECGDDVCILNGFSTDPRNNADMRAQCGDTRGGREQVPLEQTPWVDPGPAQRPEIDADELRKLLRRG